MWRRQVLWPLHVNSLKLIVCNKWKFDGFYFLHISLKSLLWRLSSYVFNVFFLFFYIVACLKEDLVKKNNRKRRKMEYVEPFLLDISTPTENREVKNEPCSNFESNNNDFSSKIIQGMKLFAVSDSWIDYLLHFSKEWSSCIFQNLVLLSFHLFW